MDDEGTVRWLLFYLPPQSDTYRILEEWERDAQETKRHNDLVEMVKSLQSFIDPKAYQSTYANTVHAVKNEQIINSNSDIGKQIQAAGDAVTRQIIEEMKKHGGR